LKIFDFKEEEAIVILIFIAFMEICYCFLFFVGVALTIARAPFSFVLVFADDALRMPSSAYEFITTSTSISDIPLLT